MRRPVVLMALLLVTVTGLAGPAEAAEDECVKVSVVGLPRGEIAELSTGDLAHPIGVRVDGDWRDCSGLQLWLRKADGSLARTLMLDRNGETGAPQPPVFWKYADLMIPVANGTGEWVITKISRGSTVLNLNVRFRVYRGAVLTLEPPARTSGPPTARTSATGSPRSAEPTASASLPRAPASTTPRAAESSSSR